MGNQTGAPRRASRPRRPLSTSTVRKDGRLVPWLAADGPLAYSPEEPPDRDYYFQYGWVLPGIFAEQADSRHRYFGASFKEDAQELFAFWQDARNGAVHRVAVLHGSPGDDRVTAPLAVYRTSSRWRGPGFLLLQHGSYQLVREVEQPLLEAGEVMLYRGIQDSAEFRFLFSGDVDRRIWRRYVAVQKFVLSDAARSFNSIHDRAVRCETGHLRDRSRMTDDLARQHGLDIDGDGVTKVLWSCAHQSFSLERWVAESKFGPRYVACKTPLDNIRLTTFFAGEHEVRIIDPARVQVVEECGCRAKPVFLNR